LGNRRARPANGCILGSDMRAKFITPARSPCRRWSCRRSEPAPRFTIETISRHAAAFESHRDGALHIEDAGPRQVAVSSRCQDGRKLRRFGHAFRHLSTAIVSLKRRRRAVWRGAGSGDPTASWGQASLICFCQRRLVVLVVPTASRMRAVFHGAAWTSLASAMWSTQNGDA